MSKMDVRSVVSVNELWRRRATLGLGVPAVIGSVVLLAYAVFLFVGTRRDIAGAGPEDDTSLYGLGYLVAAIVAVPGLVALALGGSAILLRTRAPAAARGLASAGFLVIIGIAAPSVLAVVTAP